MKLLRLLKGGWIRKVRRCHFGARRGAHLFQARQLKGAALGLAGGGSFGVFEHFVEHEGEELIIGREQLHQLLLFNLRELLDLLLRARLDSADVYV